MKAKRRTAVDVDEAGKENLGKRAKVEEAGVQQQEADLKLEEKPNSRSSRATRNKTAAVSYKEQADLRLKDEDYTTVAMEVEVDTEQQALTETAGSNAATASGGATQHRRLFGFSVVDSKGTAQPLEQLGLVDGELLVTGIVQPEEGTVSKATGRRFSQPALLKSWSLVYGKSVVQIHLKTANASYQAMKPANSYKKLYTELEEQAELMFRVYQALTPDHGGSSTASFDDVVAKLARAKVGKHYGSARDALLLNAKFVTSQLAELASKQTGKAQGPTYADGPFATGLEAALKAWVAPISMMDGNSIQINGNDNDTTDGAPADTSMSDKQMEADAELALRLQARLDAEAAMGPSRGRQRKGAAQAYTQISEAEIADDYPVPAQYSPETEETDELLLADEDVWFLAPEDLPRCQLSDFAIYNADGFYTTLELVPMWNMVDPDVELFISGVVSEDNGDWVGVQMDDDAAGAGSTGGSGGSSGTTEQEPAAEGGMRIYSSAIKEWCVDCSCDMLRISIRTDVAWYQLTKPATKYTPWFSVVVKVAKLAVHIITLIDTQTRAAKLSFNDIVKRVTDLDPTDPNFISKKAPLVERFIVVHGQIILNQMKNYPKKAVANSSFATSLKTFMERRHHFKLYMRPQKKGKAHRAVNSNPMKDRSVSGRPKPMTATATLLVKSIWQNYFQLPTNAEEAKQLEPVVEVEEDVNEEDADDTEQENALAETAVTSTQPKKAAPKKKLNKSAVQWVGTSTKDEGGRAAYKAVRIEENEVKLGSVVGINRQESDAEEESAGEPALGMVVFMWEQFGTKMAQLRKVVRGNVTVLGDAASPYELFLTPDLFETSLTEVCTVLKGDWLEREWDPEQRNSAVRKWEAMCAEKKEREEKGDMEYFWTSMYEGSKGMFRCVTEEEKELGTYIKKSSKPEGTHWVEQGVSVHIDGHEYKVNDFVCVAASTFEPLPGALPTYDNVPEYANKGRFSKGSNLGLRAWGLAQVLEWQKGNGKGGLPRAMKVRRLWRPEDVSHQAAHKSSWWDVYWSNDTHVVDLEALITPCRVVQPGEKIGVTSGSTATYTFCCTGIFDKKHPEKLEPLTEAVKKQLSGSSMKAAGAAEGTDKQDRGKGKAAAESAPKGKGKAAAESDPKGKGKAAAESDPKGKGKAPAGGSSGAHVSDDSQTAKDTTPATTAEEDDIFVAPLKSMDIFAGCGGLSEGMRQAGVAESHWAIEYEEPAAEAFRLNHPQAHVWASNCNVLLLAAMKKAGMEKECVGSSDAEQQAAAMSAESLQQLPKPGEVEFIMGGPPCQGYSGMNRFNKGAWSLVQNSMVMAYLSYADFYRPRYFLLENVRNFVAHNKSLTFRLTLRTLLDLGYQVRFGVLNAGYYGVPQSRKRTFIWAAAPGERLPDWPAPLHMFHSPQLTINLPDGSSFCAAPSNKGAPLRSVTVRDAISDLPPIENGHDNEEIDYQKEPISAYQKQLRGSCTKLRDHVCKRLNDVNMERCRCIPKETPGADWRVLLDIVKEDPSREKFKGQPLVPWCLPNTADRHNGWRGLFGRVDLDGHFPTATTEPNPMGKVGQVFHPNQDRIVSVRECARSQGFPDCFRFHGNVHNKHRQVGNAVPPPLSFALGKKLREAIKQQQEEELQRTRAKWGC